MVTISNDIDHFMEACLLHYHEELVLLCLTVAFHKENLFLDCRHLLSRAVLYETSPVSSKPRFNSDLMRSINRWMQGSIGTT